MLKSVAGSWQQGLTYTLTFLVGAIVAKVLPLHSGIVALPDQPNWSPPVSFDVLSTSISDRVNSEMAIMAGSVFLVLAIFAFLFKAFGWINPLQAIGGIFNAASESSKAAPQTAQNVDAVRDGLEKQLSALLKTVTQYLETSTAQFEEFGTIQERLASADTVDKIQAVVEVLMATSLKAQSDAVELRSCLNDAQSQTVSLRRRLAKAEKLAAIDMLTTLPNRRSFQEFLDKAVEESHADYTPLCIIMVDIDHFKRINDKFGHAAGDALLKQFARVLSFNIRQTDMVARYGGEEFVLILKKTPMGNAVQVAERIRGNIVAASWVDPNTKIDIGSVTASFGIAEIIDGETAKSIVDRADQRLYAAKKNGRNRVEICTIHR